jgi:aryl-alcohol dehydrogenase-like predicted oxidoreductase
VAHFSLQPGESLVLDRHLARLSPCAAAEPSERVVLDGSAHDPQALPPSSVPPTDGFVDYIKAADADRAVFASAAEYCRQHGTRISKLALQFSSQNLAIPTTLFSSARVESIQRNVAWYEEPVAADLPADVQKLLQPVMNKQWNY